MENTGLQNDNEVVEQDKELTPKEQAKEARQKRSALESMGRDLVKTYEDELMADADKLELIHAWGTHSTNIVKVDKKTGEKEKTLQCVGVRLKASIPLSVPSIPTQYNKDTGIPPEEVKYRDVEANTEFDLSMYEFMYLLIQPRFGAMMKYNGEVGGAYMTVKASSFMEGKAKAPTPTLNLRVGRISTVTEPIDYKGEEGEWHLVQGVRTDFVEFLKQPARKKRTTGAPAISAATLSAIALNKLLHGDKE